MNNKSKVAQLVYQTITFLKDHPSQSYSLDQLDRDAKLGLKTCDKKVRKGVESAIGRNEKIRIVGGEEEEEEGNGVTLYQYNPVIKDVFDYQTLLRALDEHENGILEEDVIDSYEGCKHEIKFGVAKGHFIAVKQEDNKHARTLFSRRNNMDFKVELSGTVDVEKGNFMVKTSTNLTNEIRRGDLIQINGNFHRVSCELKNGPRSTNLPESVDPYLLLTNDPFSTASIKHRIVYQAPRNNESNTEKIEEKYKYRFDGKYLPLDSQYIGPTKKGVKAYKHGVTNDLRKIWHELAEENIQGLGGAVTTSDGIVLTNHSYEDTRRIDDLLFQNQLMDEETISKYNKDKQKAKIQKRRARQKFTRAKSKRQKIKMKTTNAHMRRRPGGDF